jgi:hypothetical protein
MQLGPGKAPFNYLVCLPPEALSTAAPDGVLMCRVLNTTGRLQWTGFTHQHLRLDHVAWWNEPIL